MSEVQIERFKGFLSEYHQDMLESISLLEKLVYYLNEYASNCGESTKDLTNQIEFNFEEFEQCVDNVVFFKDQFRKIILEVLNEDSGNTEIHSD